MALRATPTLVSSSSSDADDDDDDLNDSKSECPSSESADDETFVEKTESNNAKDFKAKDTKLPNFALLFSTKTLQEMVSKLDQKEELIDVTNVYKQALLKFLENRISRGLSIISKRKFCDFLFARGLPYDVAERFFNQFDIENTGEIDIAVNLTDLRRIFSFTEPLDLTTSIKSFDKLNLLPGIFEILNRTINPDSNVKRLLNYLSRTKLPLDRTPFIIDHRFSAALSARKEVLANWLENAKFGSSNVDCIEKSATDYDIDDSFVVSEVKAIKKIEVSSNAGQESRLTNGDSATYWQSDGNANTHWIRAKINKNVHIYRVLIGVSVSDSSYMPQLVAVSLGNHKTRLTEVKEVFIPRDFTGNFPLLGRQAKFYRYVQINIRRCLSEGCDTRVHNLVIDGCHPRKTEVRHLNETTTLWYMSLLSATIDACLPMAPTLRTKIVDVSMNYVQNIAPFALTLDDEASLTVLTPNVLSEIDSFVKSLASGQDEENLRSKCVFINMTLALARANLDACIQLCTTLASSSEVEVTQEMLAKLDECLIKTLATVSSALARRLRVSVEDSDGDKLVQWKGLVENLAASKIYRSAANKNYLSIAFQMTPECSPAFVTNLCVKVPSARRKVADCHRRIIVYAVRDKEMMKKVFDGSLTLSSEVDGFKVIGEFSIEDETKEYEFQLVPFVTSYVIVHFVNDTPDGGFELNSVGFNGIRIEDVKTSYDEYFNIFSTTVDSTRKLLLNFLAVLNLLLGWQRNADNICSPNVDFYKGVFVDLTNLRLKSIFDCFSSLTSSASLCEESFLFLRIVYLLFSRFPKCLIIDRVSTSSSSDVEDIPMKFFDSLTSLIAISETSSNNIASKIGDIARKIIVDGTFVFFANNEERRKKLLSFLQSDVTTTKITSALFDSLCNYFTDCQQAQFLHLPVSAPHGLLFDFSDVIYTMSLLYERLDIVFDDRLTVEPQPFLNLIWSQEFNIAAWYNKISRTDDVDSSSSLKQSAELVYFGTFKLKIEKLCAFLKIVSALSVENCASMQQLFQFFEASCVVFLTNFSNQIQSSDVDSIIADIIEHLQQCLTSMNALISLSVKDLQTHGDQAFDLVTLRTWKNVESTHPYELGCRVQKTFRQPGAMEFEVTFDDQSLLRAGNYLSFFNHEGVERKLFIGAGTNRWPLTVRIKSVDEMRFSFHSYNKELLAATWGYRFSVMANGLNIWHEDSRTSLAYTLSRVSAAFCSLALRPNVDPRLVTFMQTRIWRSGFSKGMPTTSVKNAEKRRTDKSILTEMYNVETDIADFNGSSSDDALLFLMKSLVDEFRKEKLWLGLAVQRFCFATFAVFVWHVKELKIELFRLIEQRNSTNEVVSERLHQAFRKSIQIANSAFEKRQRVAAGKSAEEASDFLSGYLGRAYLCLEYESFNLNIDADEDMETFQTLSEFLLNDMFSGLDCAEFCCEELFRREIRQSSIKYAVNFLKSSHSDMMVLEFLSELFRRTNSGEYFANCFNGEAETVEIYLEFVDLLLNLQQKKSDLKLSTFFTYFLFTSISIPIPAAVLKNKMPLLIRTLLISALQKEFAAATATLKYCIDECIFDKCEYYKEVMSHLTNFRSAGLIDTNESVNHFFAQYANGLFEDLGNPSCRGCNEKLSGIRYRCTDCEDTTVCRRCFENGIGPWFHFPSYAAPHRMVRFDFTCDQCGGFIAGIHHRCLICSDYDLCDGCFKYSLATCMWNKDECDIDKLSIEDVKKREKYFSHLVSHDMKTIDAKRYPHVEHDVQLLNHYLGEYAWTLLSRLMYELGTTTTVDFFSTNIANVFSEYFVDYFSCGRENSVFDNYNVETTMIGCLAICGDYCRDETWFGVVLTFVLKLMKAEQVDESNKDENLFLNLYGRLLSKVCPKVADDALNRSSATPVLDMDDGFLTIQFLMAYGSSFLIGNNCNYCFTVADIIIKLCNESVDWALVIRNFVRQKLLDDKIEDEELKLFCALLTTGDLHNYRQASFDAEMCVTDKTEGDVRGFIVDESVTGADEVVIVDCKTRRRHRVDRADVELIDSRFSLLDVFDVGHLTKICKNVDNIENPMELAVNACYFKVLSRITAENLQEDVHIWKDLDFCKSVINQASKSTQFPTMTSRKSLETLMGIAFAATPTWFNDNLAAKYNEIIRTYAFDPVNNFANKLKLPLPLVYSIYRHKQENCELNDILLETQRVSAFMSTLQASSECVRYFAFHSALLDDNLRYKKYTEPIVQQLCCSPLLGPYDTGYQSLHTVMQTASSHETSQNHATDGSEDVECQRSTNLSKLREFNDFVVERRKRSSNDRLLAVVLYRRKSALNKKDVLRQAAEGLIVLHSRRILSNIFLHYPDEREISTLVDGAKGDVVCQLLTLVNVLYSTFDERPACLEVLKTIYERLPPDPATIVTLCNVGCQLMKSGAFFEKIVWVLDEAHRSQIMQLNNSTTYKLRATADCTVVATLNLNSGNGDNGASVSLFDDDEQTFFVSRGCHVAKLDARDVGVSSVRLECESVQFVGRFAVGYDLANLILKDSHAHDEVPWRELWSNVIQIGLNTTAECRLQVFELLTAILRVILADSWKFRSCGLDLKLLEPFRKYLNGLENSSSILPSNGCKTTSDEEGACAVLFYLAENLSLEWNVSNEFSKSKFSSFDLLKSYGQGLAVVALISSALNFDNPSTNFLKNVSDNVTQAKAVTEYLSTMCPQLKAEDEIDDWKIDDDEISDFEN